MRRLAILPAVLAALASPARLAAQHEAHDHEALEPAHRHDTSRLGTVRFANSGSRAAQPSFLRGLALLHSFEYRDAATAFRAAEHADSTFAMAYWGEALTYRHPLWGEEDVAAARQALARLGATPAVRLARARTGRERYYGAAVEALYADTLEPVRARAFADSMRQLARRYPADEEASAFAALALLGERPYLPDSLRAAVGLEAAGLAERVFGAHPTHPGAAHYVIHAYDDPRLAQRGLAAAREYASIAPDAEHALHMPSHIFLQLGLWDDVVRSNERAWAASRAAVARDHLPPNALDLHAVHWLHYAYVQQGRLRAARALDSLATRAVAGATPQVTAAAYDADILYGPQLRAFAVASLAGDMRTLPMVPAARPGATPFAMPDPVDWAAGYALSLDAVGALARGDTLPISAFAATLRAAASAPRPRPLFVYGAAILDGLRARSRGDTAAALASFETAARIEDARRGSGPPMNTPATELLGATLLASGRAAEAAAAYERALKNEPGRAEALLGVARASAAAGDGARSAAAYRQLLANWRRADADLPLLAEVRRGTRRVASRE